MLWVVAVSGAIAGVVCAWVVFVVVYRAVSNLIDGIIATFGAGQATTDAPSNGARCTHDGRCPCSRGA